MSTIRFKIDRLEKLVKLFAGSGGVLVLSVQQFEQFEKKYSNKIDSDIIRGKRGPAYLVVPQILSPEQWEEQSSFYYSHLSEPKDWW